MNDQLLAQVTWDVIAFAVMDKTNLRISNHLDVCLVVIVVLMELERTGTGHVAQVLCVQIAFQMFVYIVEV